MSFTPVTTSYGSQIAETSGSGSSKGSSKMLSGDNFANPSWWRRMKECRNWRIVMFLATFLILVGSLSIAMTFAVLRHGKNSDLADASVSDDPEILGADQKKADGRPPSPSALMLPSAADYFSYSRLTRNIPRQSNRNQVTPRTANAPNTTSSVSRTTTAESRNQTVHQAANSTNPVSFLNEKEHRHHPRYDFEHCTLNRKKTTVQSFWSKVYIPRTNETFGPAYGRNKKEAKRRVAAIALKNLYNVTYTTEVDPLNSRHEQLCRENS